MCYIRPKVYTDMPNFIRMCSLCRLPVAKKTQFSANCDIFGSSCTDSLLPMMAKFGVLWQTHGIRLPAKFRLHRFILSSCGCGKPQSLPFFWTSAFSGVANWQQSEKVEHGAQLQTFPYPTVSKSFLYSQAFMAKSGAKSLTFKSVTNRQPKKLNVSGSPAAGEMQAPPSLAW